MKVGKRTLKTCIALALCLSIYLILYTLNKVIGFNELPSYYVKGSQFLVPTNYYTPFFAGIAVCYAMGSSVTQSKASAKLRSIGSIIGGYFGVVIVLLIEFLDNNIIHTVNGSFHYYILLYTIVVIGLIPLMKIIQATKTGYAGFIACLTYLSVTISIRNGGMDAFLFGTNRILSTIIGVLLSLYVNTFPHFKVKNNNILFLIRVKDGLSIDGIIDPANLNRINDLNHEDIKLTYVTNKSNQALQDIFKPVQLVKPFIVIGGSAIYDPVKNEYDLIRYIDKETSNKVQEIFNKYNFNSFKFVFNENLLTCYYDELNNEVNRLYFERNKKNKTNLVKAKVPTDLNISSYVIIDENEKIQEIKKELELIPSVELVLSTFKLPEKTYTTLSVIPVNSFKNKVDELKKMYNVNYVIALVGNRKDKSLIECADFSVCTQYAPVTIQEDVDYVIPGTDSKKLIDFVDRVYHEKNYIDYLDSLKIKK